MQEGDTTLAWVLFWLFAAITTIATFFIADHHKSRLLAALLAVLCLAIFIGLFFALQALLRHLGL